MISEHLLVLAFTFTTLENNCLYIYDSNNCLFGANLRKGSTILTGIFQRATIVRKCFLLQIHANEVADEASYQNHTNQNFSGYVYWVTKKREMFCFNNICFLFIQDI